MAAAVDSLAQISTANTARDGSGTLVDIVTGAGNGTLIQRIEVIATGITTAGMVRLFLFDGTNNRLYVEIAVTAITPSGTVAAFSASLTPQPALPLKSGWKLKAAPHNGETFNVMATVLNL